MYISAESCVTTFVGVALGFIASLGGVCGGDSLVGFRMGVNMGRGEDVPFNRVRGTFSCIIGFVTGALMTLTAWYMLGGNLLVGMMWGFRAGKRFRGDGKVGERGGRVKEEERAEGGGVEGDGELLGGPEDLQDIIVA